MLQTFVDALDQVLPSDIEHGALLRLALRRTRSDYVMVSGRVQIGPVSIRPAYLRHYEYPELVLAEQWLTGAEARQFLSDLAQQDHVTVLERVMDLPERPAR